MTPQLSPSELEAGVPRQGLRLTGRVAIDGSEVELTDAYTSVPINWDGEATLGDLLIVAGDYDGSHFCVREICYRQSGGGAASIPNNAAHGINSEVARFTTAGVGRRLRARDLALRSIRQYFRDEAFVEVQTPVRVPSPGVEVYVEAIPSGDSYLITSPELHMKRLLVGGLPKIYQVAHASRADEQGAQHEPEFCLIEWYRAFAGQEHVMVDTEALVRRVAQATIEPPDADSLRIVSDGRQIELNAPFDRLTVSDAFANWADTPDVVALAAENEDRYFELFVERIEPRLTELRRPTFLTEYPVSQASLARAIPDRPDFAERFELYIGGVELCNGFGELTCPREQRSRMEADNVARVTQGKAPYPVDERFLGALAEGMPPSGGNALGFDRLLALCLGADDIQSVCAFPNNWR
ncbi:MAG: EF-P lysine aminoacylase GenX [Polyangiaceae bacterium]|nr:EF-P lysine aminoacylase GenX [Polyangiaceae bacterium]